MNLANVDGVDVREMRNLHWTHPLRSVLISRRKRCLTKSAFLSLEFKSSPIKTPKLGTFLEEKHGVFLWKGNELFHVHTTSTRFPKELCVFLGNLASLHNLR